MVDDCLACQVLRAQITPPGGIIYADDFWQLDHTLPPIFILGKLTLKLKRHCEHLSELSGEEAAVLGPLIQQVCRALQDVTSAQKVHLASYGEGVQHLHFLITPRMADLPASNIHLAFWTVWRRGLYRLGRRWAVYDQADAQKIADRMRSALSLI